MGDGSYVAFFEIPESPPMGRDQNTPAWVQHLALRVPDLKTLMAYFALAAGAIPTSSPSSARSTA